MRIPAPWCAIVLAYGALVIAIDVTYRWSVWTIDGKACPRFCNQSFGMQTFKRFCLKCDNEMCIKSMDGDCAGVSTKKDKCYLGGECEGNGRFTGTWSAWTSNGECPAVTDTCQSVTVQYLRTCNPTKRSASLYECSTMDNVGNRKTENCPCTPEFVSSKSRRLKSADADEEIGPVADNEEPIDVASALREIANEDNDVDSNIHIVTPDEPSEGNKKLNEEEIQNILDSIEAEPQSVPQRYKTNDVTKGTVSAKSRPKTNGKLLPSPISADLVPAPVPLQVPVALDINIAKQKSKARPPPSSLSQPVPQMGPPLSSPLQPVPEVEDVEEAETEPEPEAGVDQMKETDQFVEPPPMATEPPWIDVIVTEHPPSIHHPYPNHPPVHHVKLPGHHPTEHHPHEHHGEGHHGDEHHGEEHHPPPHHVFLNQASTARPSNEVSATVRPRNEVSATQVPTELVIAELHASEHHEPVHHIIAQPKLQADARVKAETAAKVKATSAKAGLASEEEVHPVEAINVPNKQTSNPAKQLAGIRTTPSSSIVNIHEEHPLVDVVMHRPEQHYHHVDVFDKLAPEGKTAKKKENYWTNWLEWHCMEDCNSAYVKAVRFRKCKHGHVCTVDRRGLGQREEKSCMNGTNILCNMHWGHWEAWGECTASCGESTRTRHRACSGHGNPCRGQHLDHQRCYSSKLCQTMQGNWGEWTSFDVCSVTCGAGTRKRTRKCFAALNKFERGLTCVGNSVETVPCDTEIECEDLDENGALVGSGQWSPWSRWVCDRTCGLSTGMRVRQCAESAKGDQDCKGIAVEFTSSCGHNRCRRDIEDLGGDLSFEDDETNEITPPVDTEDRKMSILDAETLAVIMEGEPQILKHRRRRTTTTTSSLTTTTTTTTITTKPQTTSSLPSTEVTQTSASQAAFVTKKTDSNKKAAAIIGKSTHKTEPSLLKVVAQYMDTAGSTVRDNKPHNWTDAQLQFDLEPKALLQRIHTNMAKTHKSFIRMEGWGHIAFHCDPILVSRITKHQLWMGSKGFRIAWRKNGVPVEVVKKKLKFSSSNATLHLDDLDPSDSGVYACELALGLFDKTIDVFTLAVRPAQPSIVPLHSMLNLTCHGAALGDVFPNLGQMWYHNGTLERYYGEVDPTMTNTHTIPQMAFSDAGLWECRIKDRITSRVWTTNLGLVSVKGQKPGILQEHIVLVLVASVIGFILLVYIIALAAIYIHIPARIVRVKE